MPVARVSAALRERLGEDASHGLIDLLDMEHARWSEQVINVASERFERRLAEQVAPLRVEFHQGLAGVRQEMATLRVELFKWSFLFWLGQLAAIAGLLSFMLPGR